MRKITFITVFIAMLMAVDSFAADVQTYVFKDDMSTNPCTSGNANYAGNDYWGFDNVMGSSFSATPGTSNWGYNSTDKSYQFRWIANVTGGLYYAYRDLTTISPSTIDNKITFQTILKYYTSGRGSNPGCLYLADDAGNVITGIVFWTTGKSSSSSNYQVARATSFNGTYSAGIYSAPATTSTFPSTADFNGITSSGTSPITLRITIVMDFINHTLDYTCENGSFDTSTRAFTSSGSTVTSTSQSFINSSASNIKTFYMDYVRNAGGNTLPIGFDMYFVGMQTLQTVATTTVDVKYYDVDNTSTLIKTTTRSDQAVGSTYTATPEDKTTFTDDNFFYTYSSMSLDNQTIASGGTTHVDVLMKKYPKKVNSTLTWTGTVDGNWNELTGNFTDGTNTLGYQPSNGVIFPAGVSNQTVSLNNNIDLGSGDVTVSGDGYTLQGGGSVSGSGKLNINLSGTQTVNLNLTNSLSGITTIAGGNVVIKKTGVLGVTPSISGTTTLISNVNSWSCPALTINASSAINTGTYTSNVINGMSASDGVKVSLSSGYNYASTSAYGLNFAANGTLSKGSELEINGTGTDNRIGMTSTSSTYLENTKVSLKGNTLFYIATGQGAAATINIGTLAGESTTRLGWGSKSDALGRTITWSVGAKNENSEFAGTITNLGGYASGGSSCQGDYTDLIKVGSGSLILSGTSNAYNGNLTVNGGELIISGNVQGNNQPAAGTYNNGPLPNTVTVAAGKKLTVSGSLTATNLVLNSDASGSATLVNTGTVTITNPVTVNEYLASARNWYVSSPVEGATVPAGYTFYGYEEDGSNLSTTYLNETAYWKAYPEGTTLTRGKGYIAQPTGETTIQYTGTLSDNSDISVDLTRTAGKTKEGFNLIGNPYPSYLNAMTAINANSNVESTIWYRTKSTAYSFETVNTTSGEGTNGVTGYIPPMQAFWVRSTAASTSLTFTNAMRSHASATTTLLKAPKFVDTQKIRLQVSNGVNTDEMLIYTNENALNGYDVYDSRKMSNDNVAIPEIWSVVDNETLVINGYNQLPVDQEIKLGFKTGQANTFTIRASELMNSDESITVKLLDKLLNTETVLTEGAEYSFTSDVTDFSTRFSLILTNSGTVTDINNNLGNGLKVFTNLNHQIVIAGASAGSQVSVFNSVGQKVLSQQMNSSEMTIQRAFVPGVYLVSVDNEINKVIIK